MDVRGRGYGVRVQLFAMQVWALDYIGGT